MQSSSDKPHKVLSINQYLDGKSHILLGTSLNFRGMIGNRSLNSFPGNLANVQ